MATRTVATTLAVLFGLGGVVKAGQVPLAASAPDIPITAVFSWINYNRGNHRGNVRG